MWQIFKLEAKSGPSNSGVLVKMAEMAKCRQRARIDCNMVVFAKICIITRLQRRNNIVVGHCGRTLYNFCNY